MLHFTKFIVSGCVFGGWRVYFKIFGNVVKCFKVFPTISKYLKIKPNIPIVLNIANYIFQTMAKYLKILSGTLEYFKIFQIFQDIPNISRYSYDQVESDVGWQ